MYHSISLLTIFTNTVWLYSRGQIQYCYIYCIRGYRIDAVLINMCPFCMGALLLQYAGLPIYFPLVITLFSHFTNGLMPLEFFFMLLSTTSACKSVKPLSFRFEERERLSHIYLHNVLHLFHVKDLTKLFDRTQ